MNKIISSLILFILLSFSAQAQKVRFVDSQFILEQMEEYTAAKQEIDKLSERWQRDLEEMHTKIEQMYKDYQNDVVLLSRDAKVKREEAIIARERDAKELQNTYFGVDGELYKKREELIKPIQDEIYNAVKEIAVEGAYAVIFDTSTGMNMLYTNPKFDISDEVLEKLGYKN